MDYPTFQATVTSLKLAADLLKSALQLKPTPEITLNLSEANDLILSAQNSALESKSAQLAMADTIRELEKEIIRIKAWNDQKPRYKLVAIVSGAACYALKVEYRGTEPPHWICTNCFEEGRKSILNPRRNRDQEYSYVCPKCGSEIHSSSPLAHDPQYAA